MKWILLVIISSANGNYVGKAEIPFHTEKECSIALNAMNEHNADGDFQDSVCVTLSHYEGDTVMENVPLD